MLHAFCVISKNWEWPGNEAMCSLKCVLGRVCNCVGKQALLYEMVAFILYVSA
jgi:hypothetical protein